MRGLRDTDYAIIGELIVINFRPISCNDLLWSMRDFFRSNNATKHRFPFEALFCLYEATNSQ